MKKSLALVLAFVAAAFGQSPVPVAKPARPIPAIEHVVVIGIDGLRPDRMLFADAPVLRGLMKTGAYSMWTRTTNVATTLPSFTSMMTGVNPRKHGVGWDRDMPFVQPVFSKTPTIFELATRAGYGTAMTAGKAKFIALDKPGTIGRTFYPKVELADLTAALGQPDNSPPAKLVAEKEKVADEVVVAEAKKIIAEARPNFMFIHLPSVDTVGHDKGWGSPAQLAQIAKTDGFVGEILAALERAGLREKTLVIVSADHGGAGLTHGAPDDPRSRTIPWIANGPGVRQGVDLTQHADLELRTEDTGATACWVLGLALPANFDGTPVRQAFTEGK